MYHQGVYYWVNLSTDCHNYFKFFSVLLNQVNLCYQNRNVLFEHTGCFPWILKLAIGAQNTKENDARIKNNATTKESVTSYQIRKPITSEKRHQLKSLHNSGLVYGNIRVKLKINHGWETQKRKMGPTRERDTSRTYSLFTIDFKIYQERHEGSK